MSSIILKKTISRTEVGGIWHYFSVGLLCSECSVHPALRAPIEIYGNTQEVRRAREKRLDGNRKLL